MNTLEPLFQWLVAASFRASLMACAVLALQLVLSRWLPARWRYALWLPVIVVLAAPALPSSPWSVENRFIMRSSATSVTEILPTVMAERSRGDNPVRTRTSWIPGTQQVLMAGWLAGTLAVLCAGITGLRQSMRRVRLGCVETSDEISEMVIEEARHIGLKHAPLVIVSTAVTSPAVTGFFRPALLLPVDFLATFTFSETRLILRHELMHLVRYDLQTNAVLCLFQVLHWFNPLLWFVFSRIRQDREKACDAQVLAMEQDDARATYGHALLKLQTAAGICPGLNLGFIGLLEKSSGIRSRILAIASHRRPHPAWALVVCILVALLVAVGATRADSPTSPAVSPGKKEIEIVARFIVLPPGVNLESMPSSDKAKLTKDGGSIIVKNEDVEKMVKALENADLLTTPRVMTHNGQPARMEVTREVVVPQTTGKPKIFPVGVTVDVTPQVMSDGSVTLDLKASVAEVVDKTTGLAPGGSTIDWDNSTYVEDHFKSKETVPDNSSLLVVSKDTGRKRVLLVISTRDWIPASFSSASQIMLPKLELKDKTVSECLRVITELARTADPKGTGINIIEKLEGKQKQPQLLSLTLANVSVVTALQHVARAAHAELRWEQHVAVLIHTGPDQRPDAEKRAELIVVPEFKVDDISITEVVKKLGEASVLADADKKGIDISLPPSLPIVKITLDVSKRSVADIAMLVATLSNMDLSWTERQAVLKLSK
ncbi:MAG: M56 family metallopeptidase [Candidatus Methylacidiphilales bacterium]